MNAVNDGIGYWKIATGQGGYLWPEQRDSGVISVGWSDMGNLKSIYGNDKAAFLKRFRKAEGGNPEQLWKFYKTLQENDWVIACAGSKIFGYGQIVGNYEFRRQLHYSHCRQVEWEKVFWAPLDVDRLKINEKIKRLFQIRSYQITVRELEIDRFSGRDTFQKIREAIRARPRGIEDISEWEGLPNAPTSEQETIVLFSKISPVLRMKISYVSTRYPDAIVRVKQGRKWVAKTAEFELLASGFEAHEEQYKSKNGQCDMIICWENDWTKKPRWLDNATEIIELKKQLENII